MLNRILSQKLKTLRWNTGGLFLGLFHGGTKMNRGNVRLSKHMTDEGRQMGEEGILATRPTHSCSKKSLGEGNPSPHQITNQSKPQSEGKKRVSYNVVSKSKRNTTKCTNWWQVSPEPIRIGPFSISQLSSHLLS